MSLLPLLLTMSSYLSTTPVVLVVRRAPPGEGCRPYLCQVGCTTTDAPIPAPDRLPASGWPVVRGHEDVAARSTSAISFFPPWKTFSRCPIRVLKMRSCAESPTYGDVRLVSSGGSGTDRTERSSGEELTGL
ncbi:hypothetical protein BHE74_00052297, partial [Ensete ventricosum]